MMSAEDVIAQVNTILYGSAIVSKSSVKEDIERDKPAIVIKVQTHSLIDCASDFTTLVRKIRGIVTRGYVCRFYVTFSS